MWITLPAIFVIAIAIIFLKNQTRPIIKLAKASEKFGRGENIDDFKPSGALEIRMAGDEFDKIMNLPLKSFKDYDTYLDVIHLLRYPVKIACDLKILPIKFYEKYVKGMI